MNSDRLAWDFDYHAPDAEKVKRHEEVRDAMHLAASAVNALAPDSREKSLAITSLEQAMFWANAAVARDGRPEDAK